MSAICSIGGCAGRLHSKGFCLKHYTRVRKHGNVNTCLRPILPSGTALRLRLASKVKFDRVTSCWNWIGNLAAGYGRIQLPNAKSGGKGVGAHRVSYRVFVGQIPNGFFVCHRCDNPRCINPKHLFLGTPKDNTQDCIRKGRKAVCRGEQVTISKLTEDQVRRIKQSSLTQPELASQYGVNQSSISRILSGDNWRHVC